MTKLEAIIQNSKMDAVKGALQEVGVEGMTVWKFAAMGDRRAIPRSTVAANIGSMIPKTKIEVVVPDTLVEKAVQAILTHARAQERSATGRFFSRASTKPIRIRNGRTRRRRFVREPGRRR